jgi:hypothetical protein
MVTLPISLLAMVIGVVCAFVALVLLRLIGLFTNLFYFGRWNTTMVSPAGRSCLLTRVALSPNVALLSLLTICFTLPSWLASPLFHSRMIAFFFLAAHQSHSPVPPRSRATP